MMDWKDVVEKLTFKDLTGLYKQRQVKISDQFYKLTSEEAKCFVSHRELFRKQNYTMVKGSLIRAPLKLHKGVVLSQDLYYFVRLDVGKFSEKKVRGPKVVGAKPAAPKPKVVRAKPAPVNVGPKKDSELERKIYKVVNQLQLKFSTIMKSLDIGVGIGRTAVLTLANTDVNDHVLFEDISGEIKFIGINKVKKLIEDILVGTNIKFNIDPTVIKKQWKISFWRGPAIPPKPAVAAPIAAKQKIATPPKPIAADLYTKSKDAANTLISSTPEITRIEIYKFNGSILLKIRCSIPIEHPVDTKILEQMKLIADPHIFYEMIYNHDVFKNNLIDIMDVDEHDLVWHADQKNPMKAAVAKPAAKPVVQAGLKVEGRVTTIDLAEQLLNAGWKIYGNAKAGWELRNATTQRRLAHLIFADLKSADKIKLEKQVGIDFIYVLNKAPKPIAKPVAKKLRFY